MAEGEKALVLFSSPEGTSSIMGAPPPGLPLAPPPNTGLSCHHRNWGGTTYFMAVSQEPPTDLTRFRGWEREGCPLAVCNGMARSIGTQIFVDEKTANGDIFLLRKNVKIFLLKLSSALCYNNVKCNA